MLLALAAMASLAWLAVAFKRRTAWPVATTLVLVTGVDLLRECIADARWDLALMLAHPVASAWCAWKVLERK